VSKIIAWSIERPKTVLFGWLVLALLAVPFAMQLTGALVPGGFNAPDGEAAKAQATLVRAFHQPPDTQLVVLYDASGPVAGAAPAAVAAASRLPGVSGVADYRTHPSWLSKDGHTTFLAVGFTSSDTSVEKLTPTLQSDVAAAVGPHVRTDVTGQPALNYELNEETAKDATRAELVAFPVLLIVLLVVFRSVAAMIVPLVLAGVTLGIAEGAGYGFARLTDVNSLYENIVSMIGLAVSIDYSLFVIKRHREELAAGAGVKQALERTMRTVGHSVLISALAVISALCSLFIPGAMSFTSIALGGATVALIAGAIVLTLLPAVLVLLGDRINWGTVGRRRELARPLPPPGTRLAADQVAAGGFAQRVLRRRPALALIALVAGFAALAFPATRLIWQVPVASASILPAGDGARQGLERIGQSIGLQGLFPSQVVLTAPANDSAALLKDTQRIANYAATAPGSAGAQAVTLLGIPGGELPAVLASDGAGLPSADRTALNQLWAEHDGQLVTQVVVNTSYVPDSVGAHQFVAALRQHAKALAGGAVQEQVTGATARGSDFDALVKSSVPLVVLTVALLSLLILTLAFRSVLLPLLALAFNTLVVGGSLGFLALTSANANHVINSVTPLMLFAVMFGLSMDYMVVMISRMREEYLAGNPHRQAVVIGVSRTAGLVNGAAIIMVAIFLASC
jgi:putative drug exporter of the RND superfamily